MKVEGSLDLALRSGVTGPENGPGAVGPGSAATEGAGGADFSSILERSLDGVNRLQKAADVSATNLARGATDDLHGTMITTKEADIALKLVGTVRNRLLDAFHELWRINL
jgi:flagellar hook-basal body complex protein FliE